MHFPNFFKMQSETKKLSVGDVSLQMPVLISLVSRSVTQAISHKNTGIVLLIFPPSDIRAYFVAGKKGTLFYRYDMNLTFLVALFLIPTC